MCDSTAEGIGELVPDDTVLYRGCSRKNFLNPTRDSVQSEAFQKAGLNHTDGLSLALTIQDAVKDLNKNHGAISIRVGDIRALNRGLEVRFDLNAENHVLLRNLPCMDRPSERGDAEATASELAFISAVASATPVIVPAVAAKDEAEQ